MTSILEALKSLGPITVSSPKTKEYRLMYRFGGWVTSKKIYAESDEEALFDAREEFASNESLQKWPYEVALWCFREERIVSKLKEADEGRYLKIEEPRQEESLTSATGRAA